MSLNCYFFITRVICFFYVLYFVTTKKGLRFRSKLYDYPFKIAQGLRTIFNDVVDDNDDDVILSTERKPLNIFIFCVAITLCSITKTSQSVSTLFIYYIIFLLIWGHTHFFYIFLLTLLLYTFPKR